MSKRIPLCVALLVALLFNGCTFARHTHEYRQTVIPPTCSSIGYTVNTCSCGETFYSDYQTAAAHTFGDWHTEQEATFISGGEEYRACSVCGLLQTRDTENLSALPKLYLDDPANEAQTASLRIAAGEGQSFTCDVRLTERPGTDGGKPAFELILLSDSSRAYFSDLGWGASDHYLLSPQTSDVTYSRTPAAEALWNACLARHISADTPEWKSAALKGYGAVSPSVTVQIYRGGSYAGLYLLTLRQTGVLRPDISTVAALRAEDESDGCLFRASPAYTDARTGGETGGFAFLDCSTANTEWATGSFSGFTEFVRRSRDSAFREQLSQYTDPSLLIDYYLLLHVFGAPYGDTVGTVWYTSDGVHWLPTFSDYQNTYGLHASEFPAPDENGEVSYAGQNLLWERLLKLFPAELAERYRTLRRTILQPDSLYEAFEAQYARIEPEVFEAEAALAASAPGADDPDVVREYLRSRLQSMDVWVNALESSIANG